MTSLVDGVRRGTLGAGMVPTSFSASVKPLSAKKINAHSSRANLGVRYITGMDGIRRPAPISPREVLQNIQSSAVIAQPKTPAITVPHIHVPKAGLRLTLAGLSVIVCTVVVAQAFLIPALTAGKAAASTSVVKSTSSQPAPKPAAPAATVQNQQQLNQILTNFAASAPSQWSIVVKDLKTGETASYNANDQMDSASLYKLFVARYIYQRIDLGQLSYSQPAGNGTGLTIEGCLKLMITVSSNPCGEALGDILGWGDENQALNAEGYTQTNLTTLQQTDSTDVALLLQRLYNGTLLSQASTNAFMTLLKDQQINNRLPQGLPAGTVIAHKTGDLYGYTHDAGIIYGPKTDYLVVVMSGSWDEPGNAPPMFANLSSQLWNYFEE